MFQILHLTWHCVYAMHDVARYSAPGFLQKVSKDCPCVAQATHAVDKKEPTPNDLADAQHTHFLPTTRCIEPFQSCDGFKYGEATCLANFSCTGLVFGMVN
jgi:hypothetical protein